MTIVITGILWVLAGDFQQYRSWLEEHPEHRKVSRFYSRPLDLRGLHRPQIIIYGTAHERRDFDELIEVAISRGAEFVELTAGE